MKFLILKSTNPYRNLAIEEFLFKNTQDEFFLLWQNEPTVVIGRNQNANLELNLEYIKENNIHIARRITGGGAVYHDLGNLNYSFISNDIEGEINFSKFCQPIIDALRKLKINACLSGRNDIEVDGKKISGNAQHREKGRVLHHGTLLFDTDLSVLSKTLQPDINKVSSHGIKSVKSRVVNIKSFANISLNSFLDNIRNIIIDNYTPEFISEPDDTEIDKLEMRNNSLDWIFPKSKFLSNYDVSRKKRYDFGTVEIHLKMENDIVLETEFLGDFFGGDLTLLKRKLSNFCLCDIEMVLCNIDIGEFFFGMSNQQFYDLILGK